jgi:hypothetical protein
MRIAVTVRLDFHHKIKHAIFGSVMVLPIAWNLYA